MRSTSTDKLGNSMRLTFANKSIKAPVLSLEELHSQGFACGFEFETVVAVPGARREDVADAFEHEFNHRIGAVCNVYAGHKRHGEADYTVWHFTRDGSIRVEQDDYSDLDSCDQYLPVEVVSPVVNTTDALDLVSRSFATLKSIGGTTNDSCGLHFTFSSSSVTREAFNPFVFLLLTAGLDQLHLRRSDRLGNRFCYPTLSLFSSVWQRLRSFCGAAPLSAEHILSPDAGRGLVRVSGVGARHRHVSINLVKFQPYGLIEYRGFGGNYLDTVSPENLISAMRQYMTCASLACDSAWIEQNLPTLLHWARALDKGYSFDRRKGYRVDVGSIPGDMDIHYVGNHAGSRMSRIEPEDSEDNPSRSFVGGFKSCLYLSRGPRTDKLTVEISHPHYPDNVLRLIVATNSNYLEVHYPRHSYVPRAFLPVIKEQLQRWAKVLEDYATGDPILVSYFRGRLQDYECSWKQPLSRIAAHIRRAIPSYHVRDIFRYLVRESRHCSPTIPVAPATSAELTQDDIRKVGCRWLNAVALSDSRIPSLDSISHLAGDSTKPSAKIYSRYSSSLGDSLAFSVVVCSAVRDREMDNLIKVFVETSRFKTSDVLSLLSSHDCSVVTNHITGNIFDHLTCFFAATERNRSFSSLVDVAAEFSASYLPIHGVRNRTEPFRPAMVSSLIQSITNLRLGTYQALIPDVVKQASESSNTRIRTSASHFSDLFKYNMLEKFASVIESSDHPWSAPSRRSLVHYILLAFGVNSLSQDYVKSHGSSRTNRLYMDFITSATDSFPLIV